MAWPATHLEGLNLGPLPLPAVALELELLTPLLLLAADARDLPPKLLLPVAALLALASDLVAALLKLTLEVLSRPALAVEVLRVAQQT